MLKKLWKMFIWAGLSKSEWNLVEDSFLKENRSLLLAFSSVVCALMGLLAIYTYCFDQVYTANALPYALLCVLQLAVFCLTKFVAQKHPSWINVLIVTFAATMYAFGIVLGSVFDTTNYALAFIILIIVVPLIFFDRPVRCLTLAFIMSIIFLLFCYMYKDFVVYRVDVLNTCVWGLASIGLNCVFATIRANNQLVIKQKMEAEVALQKSIRSHEEQMAVFQSLGNVFSSLYYVDMENRTFISLTNNKAVKDVIGAEGDALERITFFGYNKVRAEHRAEFFKFMDLNNLEERLRVSPIISSQFQSTLVLDNRNEYEWAEAYFIAVKDPSDKQDFSLKHVIFATKAINDEKLKELEQMDKLQKALSAAQSANKAKTTFLNNVSHDIRTPMNAIIGFTDLARSHIEDQKIVGDYLTKISTSSGYLLSLIDDVLDMSRIESGKIKLSTKVESLQEIADELKIIVAEDVLAKQLELSVRFEDVKHDKVICDKQRLMQILLNLLSNAIKFNREGGKVDFKIKERFSPVPGFASFEIKVRDTGLGMSEEFLKLIFQPFEREQTSTVSGIQGTGLGMSITKNLVDMMAGTIEVNSALDVGTVFNVQLNFKISEEVSGEGNTSAEDGETKPSYDVNILKGKKILLVEDNHMNQVFAQHLLKDTGAIIELAENGLVACDKLLERGGGYYDLVLMDVQMPVMDGYEATRRIRDFADRSLALVPIVAMTANAFEEDKKMAFSFGMDGHVAKPIKLESLLSVLQTVFAKA